MQGVILAAGRGSRLHPLTLNRSKAMLPILGQPIVERVMGRLAAHGVAEFILVVSPDDRDIERHFRHNAALEADVRFVYQPERRGMADALRYAAPLITGDFVLSACDNLVAAEDIGRLIARWPAEPRPNALLTVMPVEPERLGSVGIAELDGPWVRRILEKPTPAETASRICSLALYIFTRRILDYLPEVRPGPKGEYELQDAIQWLIERDGRVAALPIAQRLTLTNAADLLALNREYLLHGSEQPQLAPQTVGPGTRLITPLRIEPGTVIGADCAIGPNVYIERDCTLGAGVTLRDAVVLRGATVADGTRVENQVIA